MHLNLKPLVFRGTKGEFIHVPCGLFRSRSLESRGGADGWDEAGATKDEDVEETYCETQPRQCCSGRPN